MDTASLNRSGITGIAIVVIGIALVVGTVSLAIAADRKWQQTVGNAPWLATARSDIDIVSWLGLYFRSYDQIVRDTAPLAARNLNAIPVEIDANGGDPMAQVERLIGVSNDLSVACANSDSPVASGICEIGALGARFSRFDDAFSAVPAVAGDYYLEFVNRWTTLKQLTRFAATMCNYDAGQVSVNLATDFDDYDRLESATSSIALNVGECREVFAHKLRRPPVIAVTAHGDAEIAAQLRSVPEFRAAWGDRVPAWRDRIAFSMERAELRRSIRNPGLCHGRAAMDCGTAKVIDPGQYAKALNESLVTEQQFTGYPAGSLFRFTIGVGTVSSARRDELGATIVSVESGGVAEAAGLQAGDRIVSLGGQPVFSSADVITAVNALGEQYGHRQPLPIELMRDGRMLTQNIAIAYNKAFFDAGGWNWLNVTATHILDTMTLGLAKYADCWVIRPIGHWAAGTVSKVTNQECVDQWRRDLPILRELYWVEFRIGAFIGSLISPINWLVGHLINPHLFGVSRFGAIVRQTAVATTAHAIQSVASISPGETVQATIDRVASELPLAIAEDFLLGAAMARRR